MLVGVPDRAAVAGIVTAIVTRGNADDLLLPDESVDLIVTSPPYFGLRSYQDGGEHYEGQIGDEATPTEYLDALIRATEEWKNVLKPSGSIFVNLGDKYATRWASRHEGGGLQEGRRQGRTGENRTGVPEKSLVGLPWRYAIRCIDELGLILRAEIVWAKPNGLPESVTDRVRRSHEQVFHFVKQPRYYSAVDEVREAHVYPGDTRHQRNAGTDYAKSASGYMNGAPNPLGKLPGSVWTIPTSPLKVPDRLGVDHFAAYPPELVRRIVLGWSPPGGLVLDPFAGTGTTMLVASVLGRVGVGVDLSGDYCRLAKWRTSDPGERARVLGFPKPEPLPVGQLGLFEGGAA